MPETPRNDADTKREEERVVPIRYTRAPSFRFYHADGIFGGITPSGSLEVDFFVERPSFPDAALHKVESDGRLGPEIERHGDPSIVRERECGIIMSPGVGVSLYTWLGSKIKTMEENGILSIEE